MRKKKECHRFCSKKDYTLVPDFEFEKKIDKTLVLFTKNVPKAFINS